MKRYQGKVCLVTGGTRGIGFAIARRFAREGGEVIIVSRRKDNVQKAHEAIEKAGGKITSYVAHFGKKEDRLRVHGEIKKKFGKLDVLVANIAASLHVGRQLNITERAYDKMWEINVKSQFFLIQEYQDLLKAAPKANVLIVSSIAGYQVSSTLGIYAVTKTALLGMTKLLATELGEDGIRVNGIAPGAIQTDFLGPLGDAMKEAGTPVGVPEDIEGAAAFLCSNEARFVIGETLVVAGGPQVRL